MSIQHVRQILVEAAEEAIMPRFRALAESEVSEKSPGEVVTVADREAEELISRRLRGLLDAPVVGEEATSERPGLLDALHDAPYAWLVDPLDGTANFVAGSPDWAVMAALVHEGETVSACVVRPMQGLSYLAERGAGSWRAATGGPEERVKREPAPGDPALLRGAALTRFLDPGEREHVEAASARFAEVGPGARCAGVDYPRLIDGELDFVLFHRTLPWDHAPGTLLLREAGGVSLRPDGTPYRPGDDLVGLLNAADQDCWDLVRPILLP